MTEVHHVQRVEIPQAAAIVAGQALRVEIIHAGARAARSAVREAIKGTAAWPDILAQRKAAKDATRKHREEIAALTKQAREEIMDTPEYKAMIEYNARLNQARQRLVAELADARQVLMPFARMEA